MLERFAPFQHSIFMRDNTLHMTVNYISKTCWCKNTVSP